MKKLILLLFIFSLFNSISHAQVTRGASPAEIYLSNFWYYVNATSHYAILHSTDNGENIALKYETIGTPLPGEMEIGKVLGDALPGALYNYGNNELWVSFDYGENWEIKEVYGSSGRFTSGCLEGEIYKCCVNVQGTIWRSIDYGSEFIEVSNNAKYILEVSSKTGDLYGLDGSGGIGFTLHFSNNYGQDFITIPIDSSIAFWQVSGKYPEISRGTGPGELYLVSWWPDYHYKIFHSTDTGYTWIQKYESDYIDISDWGVQYTAGRQPGSFYVKRTTFDPTCTHTLLFIDYSSDYGETFTTYFHELDSLFTSVGPVQKSGFKHSAFPNPFSEIVTFNFDLPRNCSNPELNIYNLQGDKIKNFQISGGTALRWDGKDKNGNTIPCGIYFYSIQGNGMASGFNKLVFIR